MSSHVFRYLFIQNCTLEFSLPPSKPFFRHPSEERSDPGSSVQRIFGFGTFSRSLGEVDACWSVGQLVDMKKTDGWGFWKIQISWKVNLSSQRIDDFGKRWVFRVFFLEENGKMHGLKRKRSTMLVKSPWILSPSKTSTPAWCGVFFRGKVLTLRPWDLLIQLIAKRFGPLEKQS